MKELILFIIFTVVCAFIYGRTREWHELRNSYLFEGPLRRGKKQIVYFKYKKKMMWLGWNYYYVYADDDAIELIPPILFKFFMPKMKLLRTSDGVSEIKGLVRFKKRIIYETNKCPVLLAFEPEIFNGIMGI